MSSLENFYPIPAELKTSAEVLPTKLKNESKSACKGNWKTMSNNFINDKPRQVIKTQTIPAQKLLETQKTH
jgi:hypothetical protein